MWRRCDEDPHREFAETLIAALGNGAEPILVYSPYENTQLKNLSKRLPDLKAPLAAVQARLVDLRPIVRNYIYFPEFHGKFGLKVIGPVLCPGFTYADLDQIADGMAASRTMIEIVQGHYTPAEEQTLRQALLEYCKRDTLAMVELHRALLELTRTME